MKKAVKVNGKKTNAKMKGRIHIETGMNMKKRIEANAKLNMNVQMNMKMKMKVNTTLQKER
jgi:hypothetical protein